MSAKLPLCGDCDNGWITDEDGGLIERCPCRYERPPTPQQARDEGVTTTVAANEQAFRAALKVILDAAKANPTLSSNTVRHQMRLAQVPGPVVGAAFGQAVKDKVLRPIGYVPSTHVGTHGHPVREYESLHPRWVTRRTA